MYFLILILSTICGTMGLNISDNCEGHEHPGKWKCIKNEYGLLNLTLDCSLNDFTGVGLWIWSSKFPKDIKTLVIENCEKLYLDLSFRTPNNLRRHFSRLRLSNIKIVKLLHVQQNNATSSNATDSKNATGNPAYDDVEWLESYNVNRSGLDGSRQLPQDIVFENLGLLKVETEWTTTDSGLNLGFLKLYNVTFDRMPKRFITETTGLNQLIIDSSVISEADRDAISMDYEKGEIEITNSKMDFTLNEFIWCKVAKLTIAGNSFKALSQMSINCEADEFFFIDNKVESITTSLFPSYIPPHYSLTIESAMVNIHGNIFEKISSNAFYGIKAPVFNKTRSTRAFNFSQNEIHEIELRNYYQFEEDMKKSYETYNVYNNSINCTCQNSVWFQSMLENRYRLQKDHRLSFAWINQEDPNTCTNIPNCTLNQVMFDVYGLCNKNFQCPNASRNATVNIASSYLQTDQRYLEVLQAEKETADAVQKLLKIEMADREERNKMILSKEGAIVSLLIILALSLNIILVMMCSVVVVKRERLSRFPSRVLNFVGCRFRRGDPDSDTNSRVSLVS